MPGVGVPGLRRGNNSGAAVSVAVFAVGTVSLFVLNIDAEPMFNVAMLTVVLLLIWAFAFKIVWAPVNWLLMSIGERQDRNLDLERERKELVQLKRFDESTMFSDANET